MNSITAVIAAVLCIGIVTLIVAELSNFFDRFNEETRRIAYKMRRAQDSDEYLYWQSRLRRHYIRLLPFISEKTAGRIYSRLFKKPKHCAEESTAKEHSDGLFHILAPSVLSICLCAICLCGMSWAWFTATGNTAVSTIKAAEYNVTVTVTPAKTTTTKEDGTTETTGGAVDKDSDGKSTVKFYSAGTYTVTLTATGTATAGYCEITFGENVYHTDNFVKNTTITLIVNANASETLTVTPRWGSYGRNESSSLPTNNTLGTAAVSTNEDTASSEANGSILMDQQSVAVVGGSGEDTSKSRGKTDAEDSAGSGNAEAPKTETTDSNSTTTSVADTSTEKENSGSSGETEASTESTTETSTAAEQNSDTGKTESDSSGGSSDTETDGGTVGETPSSDSSSGSGTTGSSDASE